MTQPHPYRGPPYILQGGLDPPSHLRDGSVVRVNGRIRLGVHIVCYEHLPGPLSHVDPVSLLHAETFLETYHMEPLMSIQVVTGPTKCLGEGKATRRQQTGNTGVCTPSTLVIALRTEAAVASATAAFTSPIDLLARYICDNPAFARASCLLHRVLRIQQSLHNPLGV